MSEKIRADRRSERSEDASNATYTRPFQVHGVDRPVVRGGAVARRQAHGVDAQPGRVPAARRSRQVLRDRAGEHRTCIHREGAGCYGHNGADDVALDAALVARAHAAAGRSSCNGCATTSSHGSRTARRW